MEDKELVQFIESKQSLLLARIYQNISATPEIYKIISKMDVLKLVQVVAYSNNTKSENNYLNLRQSLTLLESFPSNYEYDTITIQNLKYFAKYIKMLPHKYNIILKDFTICNEAFYKTLYTSDVIECLDYDLLSQISGLLENVLCSSGTQSDYHETKARQ